MADAQTAANSIYDPMANADRTAAGSARDSSLSDIAASKAELQPYYAKAASALNDGENTSQARQIMADNEAGLLNGGLHANQAAGISKTYADDRSNLAQEQATKVANYDRQSANVNNSYQSALSAILDKYNGQKAAYVTDQQNKLDDRNFATSQAANAANLQRELAASSNLNARQIASTYAGANSNQSNPAQDNLNKYIAGVHSAFDGYNQNKGVKGYTEKNIQPVLQNLAIQLGIDPKTADAYMYNFRKSQFGQ